MSKVVAAFVGAEALQTGPEQRPERLDGPTARGADDRFQPCKAELDGIEVRTVWRQLPEGRVHALHGAAGANDLVHAEIVGDDDVAGMQVLFQRRLITVFSYRVVHLSAWSSERTGSAWRIVIPLSGEAIFVLLGT